MKINDILITEKKDFGKTTRNVEIKDTGDPDFPMEVTFTPPPTSEPNRVRRGYWWATPSYDWSNERNRKSSIEIRNIALKKIFGVNKIPNNAVGRTNNTGDGVVTVTVNPKFMGGPWSAEYTEYPAGGVDDLTIRKWFAMAKANAERLNATKGKHERKPADKRREQIDRGVDEYIKDRMVDDSYDPESWSRAIDVAAEEKSDWVSEGGAKKAVELAKKYPYQREFENAYVDRKRDYSSDNESDAHETMIRFVDHKAESTNDPTRLDAYALITQALKWTIRNYDEFNYGPEDNWTDRDYGQDEPWGYDEEGNYLS